MKRIGIGGAGFSGAVIAHVLAKAGYEVDVFETRSHVAGNCYSERDPETGVLIHTFGPHIFHTSNVTVWDFIRQFDEFMPFTNRVKAISGGSVYTLPINLLTINQFFGKSFSPEQAKAFIASIADKSIIDPQTFEEQALSMIGRDLYEAFFKGYTIKQWGISPVDLPASILKRLPVRFDYNDNYYASSFQGIPQHGYTYIIEKLLDHKNITTHLNSKIARSEADAYSHVFFSGPIDSWFGNVEDRLAYRTLDFVQEQHEGDYQGNAVINYCDLDVPWTRISEHKHFAPWETHSKSVIYKEHSRLCGDIDTPYYPIRLAADKAQLKIYIDLAKAEKNTTFVGRLGTYRYLDMHITIAEALEAAEAFLRLDEKGDKVPAFVAEPI